jgi:hypothetical protein
LPTALCRLPRGFAVGKAFADWVYAFADRGKQSAMRRFPVVIVLSFDIMHVLFSMCLLCGLKLTNTQNLGSLYTQILSAVTFHFLEGEAVRTWANK